MRSSAAIITVVVRLIGKASNFLVFVILARTLSVTDFGRWGFIFAASLLAASQAGKPISEIKALIYGFIAGVVAAYRGLNPKGGPKGVGDAVNQSVVITFLLLFFVNFVLTAVYLSVVPQKGS